MRLYNPHPDRKKERACTAVMGILIALFIASAIAETVLLFLFAHENLGDAIWPVLIVSYAVWLTAICVAVYGMERRLDKVRVYTDIHRVGIAMCECGHFYASSEIAAEVDKDSVKTRYTENDSGTKSESTTTGALKITCTCAKCGKQYVERISGVQLGSSSEQYKRIWFTTNQNATFEHRTSSNVTSANELQKKVQEKYNGDLARAQKTVQKYMSLGYKESTPEKRAEKKGTQDTPKNTRPPKEESTPLPAQETAQANLSEPPSPVEPSIFATDAAAGDLYDIRILEVGNGKMALVKLVHDLAGCSVAEALCRIEGTGVVMTDMPETEADAVLAMLREAGATAQKGHNLV